MAVILFRCSEGFSDLVMETALDFGKGSPGPSQLGLPNLLDRKSNTALCSSWPARRTCDNSQMVLGFSPVMFFAP